MKRQKISSFSRENLTKAAFSQLLEKYLNKKNQRA